MKFNIITIQEHPSSNLYIKENYKELEENTVLNVVNQTNGRGRGQRKWEAEPGKNLTFSLYLKPQINSNQIPLISLIIGASLYNTLSKYIKCSIKWPNDLMINDQKVGGILLESVFSDHLEALICGIGININQINFPDDLIIKATSLKKELAIDFNKDDILNQFLVEFELLYRDFLLGNNQFLKICKENNYLINKEVYYDNKKIKVIDINENGNLVIEDNGQTKELYYGEVTLNKVYKGENDER